MSTTVAGVRIPETQAVDEARRVVRTMTSRLFYEHSNRVYLFGMLHASRLGIEPDPELLYLAALFHDAGLREPYSDVTQRFEVDGADHGRRFLLDHGFAAADADTVWTAIALHTTPGIPSRMGPEIAALNLGVLTDAVGLGLDLLAADRIDGIVAAHPRGDFKEGFLHAVVDGLKDRPETANGTVNADILEQFLPDFTRSTTVDRVRGSAWMS